MENEFGYDVETALVLNVLALGCLAVKAHEEGDFALPSRHSAARPGFEHPDWYELVADDPPGLKFFNEARHRFGFLMCENDIQAGQFYMLSTLYYAQILRPLDSWTTVNRAALCCASILTRSGAVDYWTMSQIRLYQSSPNAHGQRLLYRDCSLMKTTLSSISTSSLRPLIALF